jgi:RNA polymerase sigma factor (sigma-70 family)
MPEEAAELTPRMPVDHEDVGALLLAGQAGDREALAALVRRLTPVLWHVARSQGLGREASADVVQTAWLELLGSLNGIRNPAALTAWLVTVTKREAWRVRKASRAEDTEEGAVFAEMPDIAAGPAELAVDHDRRQRLWAAVDRLPERCRTLLRIVAFAPRPDYSAVSEALGMPVGSIGPNRGRCLAKLRALLRSDPKGGWR